MQGDPDWATQVRWSDDLGKTRCDWDLGGSPVPPSTVCGPLSN